nr:MAG TPA: PTS HPr component phosphorylation site [Caudoviricetes sp.]
MNIRINDTNAARKLVSIASNKKYADYDIDCICGRYIIDMKSIMGMLSFALPTDVDIVIRADGDIEKEFYEHVKRIAS